jgi:tRNA-2-methylthio-N6-dimethylallyladenosine synthase
MHFSHIFPTFLLTICQIGAIFVLFLQKKIKQLMENIGYHTDLLEDDVIVSSKMDDTLESEAGAKKYYIESYGCQMNVSDSEIVAAVLNKSGYRGTSDEREADLIFLNTCSIRDKAEQTVRNRLQQIKSLKKTNKGLVVGVLGCMAERLKSKLLEEEQLVDIVAGPDTYRDLPRMISDVDGGQKAVNVLLSREETYADISPVRYSSNGVTGFISIMRGCDNMCAFCVVPFTRGRERSRSADTIVAEAREMVDNGFKEVTLLGQNVDSYRWSANEKLLGKNLVEAKYSDEVVNFAKLLELVAQVSPSLRVRFSTSHPKDMTDDVLEVMSRYDNICKYIHLPVQSGSSSVLERMNRTYDRSWYLNRIDAIRKYMPNCAISSDVIAGFCGETEEEHQETLSMMDMVKYDMNYMFFYSERPGTLAAKRYTDDIPEETKKRRLTEIVNRQNEHALERNQAIIGTRQIALLEYTARRSNEQIVGRTDGNKKVIIPKGDYQIGDYVEVEIESCTQVTLMAKFIKKIDL